MPTTAELERLTALLERLGPLAAKRRGELIEADDWNTVVGAVAEVARAALSEVGEDGDVPTHEHPDQVGVGWLDPRLRALLTGGGSGDAGRDVDLSRLRRDLGGLTARLDRTETTLGDVRLGLSEVSTRTLAREGEMTRLGRKVLGADDARADIADVRGSLQSIQQQVAVAVEVGRRLEVDGQPVDVAGLQERVRLVEELRERLTRSTGALLDAAEFDRQIADLRGSLVTQETLTTSLGELRRDILDRRGPGVDRDAILDEARAAARDSATTQVDALSAKLRAALAAGLGEIAPAVAGEVQRATGGLAEDLRGGLRGEVQQLLSAQRDSLAADLAGEFQGRLDHLSDELAGRLREVAGAVSEQVRAQLHQEVPGLVGDLGERLRALEGTVVEIDRRTQRIDRDVVVDRSRLEEGLRAEARGRSDLRTELDGRLAQVGATVPEAVRREVGTAREAMRSELEAGLGAARRDLTASLAEVARQQASTEVKVLSTGIRGDVQGVVRQEVEATLQTVREGISAEVENLRLRIGGLVADEVSRVAADIPSRVRAEIDAFRPELTRLIDDSVTTRIRLDPRVVRPNPFRPNG